MMNETFCTYDGRRDDALVAYLYDDIDPLERAAFERHLQGCLACRTELDALSNVRDGLADWAAPDVAEGVGGQAPPGALRLVDTPVKGGWRVLADAPVWMQAAAAMLVVAVSLGLANISLTYSRAGLVVTTGWMRSAPELVPPLPVAAPVVAAAQPAAEPWRTDLSALEQKVLRELKARPVGAAAATDTELIVKRVRALIEESERRQQRELALRVAEVARDAQTQRQADLVKIDHSLGLIQSRTGVEVMRTQQQLNTLAQRVSQRE
jgi:Putative zinc-finger